MRIRWLVAVASMSLLLATQTSLPAYATSVTSVSITPADLTAGATTTYSVSFFATTPVGAGGTITIDWTGDGVSEGVLQPLLPATVTFPSAPCSGTATVANGNSVISLSSPAGSACSLGGNVQFTITNVRNSKVGSSSAGSIQTSADAVPVADSAILTWTGGGLSVTASTSPGAGPSVTTIDPNGVVAVNYYPQGLEPVTFTTTRGTFTVGGQQSLICADFSACDADGALNRVITVLLMGDGTSGTATVTATAHIPSGRTSITVTTTTTLTFAVAPPPPPAPQTVVTATATGIFCFPYSGAPVPVAGFSTLFAPTVASVNVFQLPAGNFLSWFQAAPGLATVQSLGPNQVICVSAPVGSNVFA